MAQTVYVNKAGSGGAFTTIQGAIDALAPGGAQDDADRTNNVIYITDNGTYVEGLTVSGCGITIDGYAGGRPIIVAGSSVATPGLTFSPSAATESITLRGLIFLPNADGTSGSGIVLDDGSGVGIVATLEDVVITANNGSNAPGSLDGRTPPPGAAGVGHFRYSADGILLNSTNGNGSGGGTLINMTRVIVTGAAGDDGISIFTDFGDININAGCVFTFNSDNGVDYPNSSITGLKTFFNGSSAQPIIIHGNGNYGIFTAGTSDPQLLNMSYVCITGNSTNSLLAGLDYKAPTTAPPTATWNAVTIAGNMTTDLGGAVSSHAGILRGPINATNCIFAGDGAQNAQEQNLFHLPNATSGVTGTGICLDLSGSGTSVNVQARPSGTTTGSAGAFTGSVTNLSPQFVSLDPASADYCRVGNAAFLTLGPGGGALTGAGPGSALTPSPSLTPTVGGSPTSSPTASLTPTATPSSTPSMTASISPSISPTASPSQSPTATPPGSPTPSLTPSVSPTPTATPTISQTPSISPTATMSFTPSLSPTVSATPTISPTASVSPTPSLSITPSVSPTPFTVTVGQIQGVILGGGAYSPANDVNGDGVVDVADIIRLLRMGGGL